MKKYYLILLLISLFTQVFAQLPPETPYVANIAFKATGTKIDDVAYGPFNIGYTFNFYGNNYTQFWVSSNGLITFGSGSATYTNYCIPNSGASPNNMICAFWDDIMIDGTGAIYYQTIGAAPNRQLIVQWTNMTIYNAPTLLGTFSAILYETSNNVQVQYRSIVDPLAARPHGSSATIGLENSGGTAAVSYACNTADVVNTGKALLFTRSGATYTLNSNAAYQGSLLVESAPYPGIPAMVSPANNAVVGLSTNFQWSAASNATTYSLQISSNSDLSAATAYAAGTATSFTPPDFTTGITRYWAVWATNSSGTTWSEIRKFSTSATPPLATIPQSYFVQLTQDIPIQISYTGGDASAKTAIITSLPASGALYQYNNGVRGAKITSVPTTLTDASMRVIYAATGSIGNGMGNFGVKVHDNTGDSPIITTTVNVSALGAPNFLRASKSTNTIEIQFDRLMGDPAGKQAQFTISDGSGAVSVTSIALKAGDSYTYILTLGRTLSGTVNISYTAGTVASQIGGLLLSFSAQIVSLTSQTITFGALPVKNYGDAAFALSATASSALAVTYSSSNTSVATISGTTCTITGVGSTTITALQAGNGTYSPATYAQVLTVNSKNLTVTGATAANKVYDGTTTATISGGTLNGIVGADVVALATATSGTFASSALGIGKTVTSAMTLTGSAAGNYTITQPTLTANITPKALTVTGATAVNKVYDAATTATISGGILNGIVGSEVVALATATSGTFASSAVGTGKTVTSAMTLTGADAGNYTVTQPTLIANITGKALTVTGAMAANKVYDGATTATISGGVLNGIVGADVVTLATATSGTFASSAVGLGITVTSAMTLTGAAAGNYTITQPTLTANITVRPITITPDAGQTKVFGTSDATYTYTVSPALIGGDAFTGALTRDAGENIGAYPINKGTLSAGINYTITMVAANYIISAKAITITANAGQTKIYGDPDPIITYTASPALNGTDVFTGVLTRLAGENAGSYAINQCSVSAGSNYTITYVPANFVITKANQNITLSIPNSAALNTFIASSAPVTATSSASLTVVISKNAGSTATATLNNNSGNYSLTNISSSGMVIIDASQAGDANYNAASISNSFDVTKGNQVLTPGIFSALVYSSGLTYDLTGAAPSNAAGLLPTYSVVSGPATITGNTLSISNWGTIQVQAVQAGNASWNAAPTVYFDIVVNKALPTITSFTPTSAGAGTTVNIIGTNLIGATAITFGSTSASSFNVISDVSATAVIGAGSTGSVSLTTLGGTATKAGFTYLQPQAITFGALSTYNYGNAPFTVSATGGLSGNPVIFTSSDPSVATCTGTNGSTITILKAGSCNINANQAGNASFVAASQVSRTLTVDAKAIMVTVTAGQTKVYGTSDAITYTVTPALVSGDAFTGSLARAVGEDVGSYAVSQSTLSAGANYSIIYVGNNYVITTKPITVTVNAHQTKEYGASDAVFTYSVSPALKLGDSFIGNLARTTGENIGSYAINQGSLSAGANYSTTFVADNYSITAKPITVTVNAAQTKVYGASDAAYTYSVSPALIGGDVFTGLLTRAAGENVGSYSITQGTLSAGTNYSTTYVGNTYSITAKNLTVTADAAQTKVYGDFDPSMFTYSISPALIGSDFLSGSLTRLAGENAGSYAINQGTLTAGSNYNVTYVPANFTITKANQSITLNIPNTAALNTFIATSTPVTATSTAGLTVVISKDGASTATATLNNTAGNYSLTGISATGTITINANQAGNANYNPTSTSSSFDVTKGNQTLTLAAIPALIYSNGLTYDLTSAASSNAPGLNPTYTVVSGPGSISGNTLSISNWGTIHLQADEAGNVSWNAAPTAYFDIVVNKALPTITSFTPTSAGEGSTVTITGTFLSGATAVSFGGTAASLFVVDDQTSISAVVAAGSTGNVAVTTDGGSTSIAGFIYLQPQSITFNALSAYNYGNAPFTVSATGGASGNPVVFTSSDPTVATCTGINGSTITILKIGSCSIYANQAGNAAYTNAPQVSQTLIVNTMAITVTVDAGQTKVYGAADAILTYTVSPALVGSDAFRGLLTRAAGENVGSYSITQGTLSAGSNYIITYVGDNYSITALPITVTANAGQSKEYGTTDAAFAYSVNPALVAGDAFTGALTRAAGENVSSYAITQGTLSAGSNYAITYISDNYSITAQPITVTANANQTKVYGSADATFSYSVSPSLKSGDVFTGALTRAIGENTGNYAISIGTLSAGTNYSTTFVADNYSITAKPITITANAGQTKVYGNNDATFTYSVSPALIGSDAFTGTLAREAGENIGLYTINIGTLSAGTNYTNTFVAVNYSITAKPITVTVDAGQTKVYGAADAIFTYTVSPALVTGDAFTGTLSRAVGENKGSYAVAKGTLNAGTNYITSFIADNYSITAKPITVTVNTGQTKVYGATDATFTYSASPALIGSDAFIGALARTAGENVGSYAINVGTLSTSANYSIIFVADNYSITEKPITVTANASQTKVYGATDVAFTYSVTPALIGSDAFIGALTRAVGENTGNYAISVGTLSAGTNYSTTFVADNYSITKKAIAVTTNAAQTKVYGATDATFTYSVSPALIGSDAFTGALARDAGENVGNYAINVGTLSAGTNYTTTFVADNYGITAKPITVTANAGQTKISGTSDPVFTYSVSPSLITGDAFTGTLGRVVGEAVGSYAINQSTLSAGSNYTITFVAANFSITPADVTPPDVTLTTTAGSVTSSTTIPVTITFSEPVVGFVMNNVTVTNGTKSGFSGSSASYTLNVTPTALGVVNIDIAAGVTTDAAGNGNNAAVRLSVIYDNVAPTVALTYIPAKDTVKAGDVITFTATFSDANAMSESPAPSITIENVVVSATMSKTSNKVWTYAWTVPAGVDITTAISVTATDAAGNSVIAGTNLHNFVIDNTPPVVTFTSITGQITVHVFDKVIIDFSEKILRIVPNLSDAIIFREGGKTGTDLAFTVGSSNLKSSRMGNQLNLKTAANGLPQITALAALKCNTTYYIALKAGSFSDVAGNLLPLYETTFKTDTVPVQPLIAAVSSASVKTSLCAGDVLSCSNANTSLAYTWQKDGVDLTLANAAEYALPDNAAGAYSLKVVNNTTTCTNISAVANILEYPANTPVIYEKKKSGIVSILVVDNTSNAFQTYKWTYADGSELPTDMANTNQFLVLSPERMNAQYKVAISDTNSCKQLSALKSVTLKSAEVLVYPTVASENFKINFVSPEKGNVNIQVVNTMGVVMQKLTMSKSNIVETYNLQLNNVPDGTYYIVLQMGDFKDTKQVIVQK